MLIALRPSGFRRVCGQQFQLTDRGVGETCADPLLLGGDHRGGGLADRQPPAEPVGFGVVVDEHRGRRLCRGRRQSSGRLRMSSGRRPVSMPIWVATLTSTGSRVSRWAHSTAMISGGRSRPGSPRSGSAGMSPRSRAKSPGSPAAACPGRVRPRARIPASTCRTSRQMHVAVVAADLAGRFQVASRLRKASMSVRPSAAGIQPVVGSAARGVPTAAQSVDLAADSRGAAAAVPGQLLGRPPLRGSGQPGLGDAGERQPPRVAEDRQIPSVLGLFARRDRPSTRRASRANAVSIERSAALAGCQLGSQSWIEATWWRRSVSQTARSTTSVSSQPVAQRVSASRTAPRTTTSSGSARRFTCPGSATRRFPCLPATVRRRPGSAAGAVRHRW